MIIKLTTADGIVGYGETGVEGAGGAAVHLLESLQGAILDCDPRSVESTWATLTQGASHRGGPLLYSVVSGVEQALWDIKGKSCGLPIYEMLGGACRDHIRMYASCGHESSDDVATLAKGFRVRGYTAIKVGLGASGDEAITPEFVERIVSRISNVRKEMGPGAEVAVDFGAAFPPASALRLIEAIAPSFPMFVESPCPPDNVDALLRIASATKVPLAAGGALLTRWGCREVLEKQAVAVLQPVVAQAGGILECRKIAAMAEPYDVSIALRSPVGPISLAASIQVAACSPNFLIQEHLGLTNKADLGLGFLQEPFEVKEGYVRVPQGPGLGVEIDESAVGDRLLG